MNAVRYQNELGKNWNVLLVKSTTTSTGTIFVIKDRQCKT